jgi:hypothetical protein
MTPIHTVQEYWECQGDSKGIFIDAYNRCDGIYQCKDRSDESQCPSQHLKYQDTPFDFTLLKKCNANLKKNKITDGFLCGHHCLTLLNWCSEISSRLPFFKVFFKINSRQTDRQTKDRQTDRQTDVQPDRQRNRQHKWTDRQTDRQTNGQTDKRTDIQTDRQTDRQMNRQTYGQTDRQIAGQIFFALTHVHPGKYYHF